MVSFRRGRQCDELSRAAVASHLSEVAEALAALEKVYKNPDSACVVVHLTKLKICHRSKYLLKAC